MSDNEAVARAIAAGDLTFGAPGHAADLPPVPEADPKVVCSFRLPVDVYQRLKDVATERGVKPTALIRDFVMAGLASTDEDRTISVADLLRVVAALPKAAA